MKLPPSPRMESRSLGAVSLASNFVAVTRHRNHIFLFQRSADGLFVGAEMHGGPQFQPDFLQMRRAKTVGDMNGVLTVNEQNALFNDNPADFVPPNRNLIFQAEIPSRSARLLPLRPAGWVRHPRFGCGCRLRNEFCPSPRWLNITIRPSGAGSAATSRPWYRHVDDAGNGARA